MPLVRNITLQTFGFQQLYNNIFLSSSIPPLPHMQLKTLLKKELLARDMRSFVIRFDFESYVRFEIRFVVMVRFEIFKSSALSNVIRKETIGVG